MLREGLVIIFCLLLVVPVGADTPDKNNSGQDAYDIGYSLRVSVSLVQVTATVRNRMGQTVHDLDKDDFKIYEGGEVQEIVEFANARGLPKRILILLDVSGSMRIQNKIGVAKKGLRTLIGTLRDVDEVSLVFFADGSIEIASNYTKDRDVILDALGEVHAYGKTALRDAVRAAPALARVDDAYQRCMLLVTDGIDNASEVSMEEALDAARKVDLPIYAMGFDPYSGRQVRPFDERQKAIESLKILAEHTGGRFTLVGRSVEMLSGMDQMIRDLENQYLIGFISKNPYASRHHRIEVKSKRGYDVRARQGYFVDE